MTANPDGTFTAVAHREPVRVRRGQGWVPVDTTLARRLDGTIAPVAAAADMVFSAGGDGPLATLRRDGGTLTLGWPGRLPAPVLAADTATYPEVLPGVDLVVRATATGYGEVLVVKTPQAARQQALSALRFALKGTGLSLGRDAAGNITATTAAGKRAVTGVQPWMWESSGATADRHGPGERARRLPMRQSFDGRTLTVVPDPALLRSPAASFPLYLDPAFNAGRLHWTMASSDLPNHTGWYDSTTVSARVGHDPKDVSDTDRFRSYFEMNTALMAGKHIISATFRILQKWAYSCTPETVSLWQTGPLTATTTWNNAPAMIRELGTVSSAKGSNAITSTCAEPGEIEFDATPAVVDAAAAGATTATVALRACESYQCHGAKTFDTNPALVVVYNTVPGAPSRLRTQSSLTCPATGDLYLSTATPHLEAQLDDADGGDLGQQVRGVFQWATAGGASVIGSKTTEFTAPGNRFAADVPAGAFADNAGYAWRVQAHDGVDAGPWSPWCNVRIDTTPPTAAPTVASTSYPENTTAGRQDQPGTFTFGAAGVSDVTAYRYGLNSDTPSVRVEAGTLGGSATVSIAPDRDWGNFLTVVSLDRAGNPGPPRTYSFAANPLNPAMMWLPFYEGSGDTAYDWAGGSGVYHDVTLAGGATWTEGRQGGALRFAGLPARATTAGPVVASDAGFTVMAWLRLSDDGASAAAVAGAGARNTGYELRYDRTSRRWAFQLPVSDADGAAVETVLSDTAAQPGIWTHLAGVFDADTGRIHLYVNGRNAGSATRGTRWNATGPLTLGCRRTAGNCTVPWLGDITEVKVFDFAAAPRKIGEEMQGELFGPEGAWQLDEGTGTVGSDSSGNGNAVALADGAAFTAAGRHGGGLRLDGTGGHAFTAGPVVRTDASFTVTAWAKLDRADTTVAAASQDGTHDSGFMLGYSAAPRGWTFTMNATDTPTGPNDADRALYPVPAQTGVWVHLAGVYDAEAAELRLYVDGQLAARTPSTTRWRAGGALQLGRWRSDGSPLGFWPGDLDDVRIVDRVMPDAEIRSTMNGDSYAPQARYELDEGTGAVSADGTGNGHTLALAGPAWSAGHRGGALRFDGVNDEAYTSTAVVRTDSSFTAMAWVRTTRTDVSQTVLSQDGVADSGFDLRLNATNRRWELAMARQDSATDNTVAVAYGKQAPLPNFWTHVAGVYDATRGELRLYVDGVLVATTGHRSDWNAAQPLQLGRSRVNGAVAGRFSGDIDEVRVMDRAASAAEIQGITGLNPHGGQWPLNDGGGTEAVDGFNNGNTLRLSPSGATWTTGINAGALAFNGSTGYAATPAAVLRTDASFTVAAWVRLDAAGGTTSAVSQDGVNATGVTLGYSSSAGRWRVMMHRADTTGSSEVSATSTSTPATGRWTHLAGVYDATAGQLRLYVNGQLETTVSHTSTWQAGGAVQVGRWRRGGAYTGYWNGRVDDVTVFNRAATAAEVLTIGGFPDAAPYGAVRLKLAHSGLCVGENSDGTLVQKACPTVLPSPSIEPLSPTAYAIRTFHPTYGTGCVAVSNNDFTGVGVYNVNCFDQGGLPFPLNFFDTQLAITPVVLPVRGYRITVPNYGDCLGITGNSMSAGAALMPLPCSATAAGQVFQIEPNPTGTKIFSGPPATLSSSTLLTPVTVWGVPGNAPNNLAVTVNVTVESRAGLRLTLLAPDGTAYPLATFSSGDTASNISATYRVNASSEVGNGIWKLEIRGLALWSEPGTLDGLFLAFPGTT
ncbi:hypothetical protein Cci01nite_20590 [Catellatospora citrea]|uniref:P/Homo B domain-containing protein n=1 Tax=Catellatospora citrea TaxID=53366 RepID=A0A8J3P030_9ACTN|nr:hypothetical protein Cci01nite_20590 [Catellatospora citrea]